MLEKLCINLLICTLINKKPAYCPFTIAFDLKDARLQIPPQEIYHPSKPMFLEFVESRLLLSVLGLIAWGLL
jgi:hypothetical protein